MQWWDDTDDQTRMPQRWMHPVTGDGLLTIGTGKDDTFGYCYQPYVVTPEPGCHFVTPSSFTPHGFDKTIQGGDHNVCGWHPFFATREQAVAWLKDRNLEGEVVRYAHTKPLDQRVPTWEFDPICRRYHWVEYKPWMTAGTTDRVTHTQDHCYRQLLCGDFDLHQPDGSVKTVTVTSPQE